MKSTLDILDKQIAARSADLQQDAGLTPEQAAVVASSVWREVAGHTEAMAALRQSDPVPASARLAQIHSFFAWNAEFLRFLTTVAGELTGNIGVTGLVVQAYYSFVYLKYLKDTLFEPLRDSFSPPSVSALAARYLLRPEIRAVRNAFAHGNWLARGDETLTYWARGDARDPARLREWTVESRAFDLWLRLSRGVAIAALDAIASVDRRY